MACVDGAAPVAVHVVLKKQQMCGKCCLLRLLRVAGVYCVLVVALRRLQRHMVRVLDTGAY